MLIIGRTYDKISNNMHYMSKGVVRMRKTWTVPSLMVISAEQLNLMIKVFARSVDGN